MSSWVIGIGLTWLGLIVFIGLRGGLFRGRRFGNRIARHLGISNNLFHSLMDEGTGNTSLSLLAQLSKSHASVNDAAKLVAPILDRGYYKLVARFGQQKELIEAKTVIDRLLV